MDPLRSSAQYAKLVIGQLKEYEDSRARWDRDLTAMVRGM